MKKFIVGLFLCLAAALPAHATISCSLPFTLTNGTLADATQVMANYNALVTCFTNAASAGANSDITSLNGLTTPITPAQGGTNVFIGGTSTGSSNAQVLTTTTPNTFTLTKGYSVVFVPGFTNLNSVSSGATTLNVNSTGVTNVFRQTPSGPQALVGGELANTQIAEVTYDGTEFVLKTTIPGLSGGFGALTNLASSGTTDLGTITTHNVNITGITTITAFGSSASTIFPIYQLTFAGSLTLTNNATSLILPGTANITTAQNDTAVAQYLGSGNWQILSYTKANGTAIVNPTPLCGTVNLLVKNNSGTPNTNIDYTADSAVLINPTGNVPFYAASISGTINTTNGTVTSTADGMDGEARPTSAYGYVWLISNGTSTNGLVSTTLSPTMPAGYIYRCRVSAFPYDGSQNQFRMRQAKAHMTYVLTATSNTASLPLIALGTTGTYSSTTPTYASIQVTGNTKCAPTTATEIDVIIASSGHGNTIADLAIAPNAAYGGPLGTNPPPISYDIATSLTFTTQVTVVLESANLFVATNGTGALVACKGWVDAVNAN